MHLQHISCGGCMPDTYPSRSSRCRGVSIPLGLHETTAALCWIDDAQQQTCMRHTGSSVRTRRSEEAGGQRSWRPRARSALTPRARAPRRNHSVRFDSTRTDCLASRKNACCFWNRRQQDGRTLVCLPPGAGTRNHPGRCSGIAPPTLGITGPG